MFLVIRKWIKIKWIWDPLGSTVRPFTYCRTSRTDVRVKRARNVNPGQNGGNRNCQSNAHTVWLIDGILSIFTSISHTHTLGTSNALNAFSGARNIFFCFRCSRTKREERLQQMQPATEKKTETQLTLQFNYTNDADRTKSITRPVNNGLFLYFYSTAIRRLQHRNLLKTTKVNFDLTKKKQKLDRP